MFLFHAFAVQFSTLRSASRAYLKNMFLFIKTGIARSTSQTIIEELFKNLLETDVIQILRNVQ